jgi:hypothetical protein
MFRQQVFDFWQPIIITVAKVLQKATALVLTLGNSLDTNNALITVAYMFRPRFTLLSKPTHKKPLPDAKVRKMLVVL